MTQEAFIKILDKKRYSSYEIEGDKIVVTHEREVDLDSLTSFPSGVEFKNGGDVYLQSLTSIHPGVEFKNGGDVYLRSLTSLPPGVEFKNEGYVDLQSLTSIHPGVEFKNGGDVWLRDIIGGWFNIWESNIEGIDSKRLLNVMIKQGVFER